MTDFVRAARPNDLGDVTAITGRSTGSIAFIAGGTDLIIAHENLPWPDLIIDITGIAELDFVDVTETAVQIGAATTMSTLDRHKGIRKSLPLLAQASAQVGSAQIRNRATIGGNIASAVPAGDLLPVLKCLEVRIEILRHDGRTEVLEFDDVVVGSGETSLGNGDLITGIVLPLKYGANRISAFAKIGMREVLTIARLNMAIAANYDQAANRVSDIRVVAGAVGPLPLRLPAVEAVFQGRVIDQSLADDFLNALVSEIDNAIPGRYSQSYKRRAIIGLGLDLLRDLFDREFSPALPLMEPV